MERLELIVSAFLDLAENRAKRHIPMTMEDWSTRIDKFLLADDLDILKDADKISHEIACDKALTEFEKNKINYINLILIYYWKKALIPKEVIKWYKYLINW